MTLGTVLRPLAHCCSYRPMSSLNELSQICFQIKRDTGLWYSVEYSSFSVSPEADKYRLSVSGCSGDEGDALATPAHPFLIVSGVRFSTPDQDNDNHPTQCAPTTGWWVNACARSILNVDTNAIWNADTTQLVWDVQFARMMVKLG